VKKLFVIAVAFAVALLVGGPALVSVAQTASDTAGTSVSNNAVFVTTATDFPAAPTAIAIADVEAGCKSLGSATFNVDATSGWTATQIVTANSVPTLATSSTSSKNDPFHLDTTALCPSVGTNGATGLTAGTGNVTSGGTGENVVINAGVFFSGAGANFTDAPNGSYGFTVTMTVSD